MSKRHSIPKNMWSESDHQAEFIAWVDATYPQVAPLLIATLNGSVLRGGARQYNALVSTGLRKGAPDLIYLLPRGRYHFAAFEMKKPEFRGKKGGGLREGQPEYLERIRQVGGLAVVTYGADDAIEHMQACMELGGFGTTTCPKCGHVYTL